MSLEADQIVSALIEDEEFSVKDVSLPDSPLLAYMLQGILEIGGSVKRGNGHYVHEYTTSIDLAPYWNFPDEMPEEDQEVIRNRGDLLIDELEKTMKEEVVSWNRKIYRELEAAYEDSVSEAVIAEEAREREWLFDEEGNLNQGELTYDQLSDRAKSDFRSYYAEHYSDSQWWSEPVVAEWKWLLANKGFTDVEISWSGFWSQGDGASFTAKHIDAKLYLTGPDPLTFPENEREQIDESEEEDKEMAKEVSGVTRQRVPDLDHIRTPDDYHEYQQRVAEFFQREGVDSIFGVSNAEGEPDTNEFSKQPCDVCQRSLAGAREHYQGHQLFFPGHTLDFWICTDCVYYLEYGKLDDATMMAIGDAGNIQERYGGAAKEIGIWYHGTSTKLLPKILSQGLIPDPKQRSWDKDETSIVSASRKSIGGIYVTTNLGTATSSALRVAQRDKAERLIVIMELQPRSLIADEDDVGHTTGIQDHLSDSAYHHIYPYFLEFYPEQFKWKDEADYMQRAEAQKLDWVKRAWERMTFDLRAKGPVRPELEKRVKELLFNEGYRTMLARNVAYVGDQGSWDRGHYKSDWSRAFGEYDTEPPIPDKEKAEADWLAFKDKLTRTLKDKARPLKAGAWSDNIEGRLMGPVGYTGTNRIVCIVEEVTAREPDYHSRLIVHYGKPPEKFLKDWQERVGALDREGDITYKKHVQEAESHWDAFRRTGFWGAQGAGGIFIAKDTGRILLGLRSNEVEEPNTWGVFGGAIEEGQSPTQSAEREMREETGYSGPLRLVPLYVYSKGSFKYYNFAALVEQEFEPQLNLENSNYAWVEFGQWPQPLHFGLAALLQHSDRVIQYLSQQRNESQDWFYEVKEWDGCQSINYRLSETGPSVGGHTFPKALTGDDLKLIAETQIRVFKGAGRFEPGSWRDVWDWLSTANAEI